MKSYTNIEQSKVLAKILPIKSADMYYPYNGIETYPEVRNGLETETALYCWSLVALFGILTENKLCHYDNRYYCQYISEGGEFPIYSTAEYDNPVDACVAMIEKLHELNLL